MLPSTTQVGVFQPPGFGNGLGAGIALGTQPPKVCRVLFIAGDLDDAIVGDLHDDAAPHPAVGTDTLNGMGCHGYRHGQKGSQEPDS